MGKISLAKTTHLMMTLVLVLGLLLSTSVVTIAGSKHVSIKNKLGSERNMTLHCQSKDNDLGKQNIEDGSEFGWDFSDNIIGTTLFFCDLAWDRVQQYYIDAYSFGRDFVRCKTGCSWLVAAEGIYGLNGQTGFWEFMYNWPN
ncbi:self-incompatibility protein S1-like [Lotus japonicus]|uniref:self-incompatibility protein S1-like n=1 Tax=Lotus japonicus TaxID=34305 RepID=UPI002583F054|nr:self-incompatibility protein S1-like [Lotus japonicus]